MYVKQNHNLFLFNNLSSQYDFHQHKLDSLHHSSYIIISYNYSNTRLHIVNIYLDLNNNN